MPILTILLVASIGIGLLFLVGAMLSWNANSSNVTFWSLCAFGLVVIVAGTVGSSLAPSTLHLNMTSRDTVIHSLPLASLDSGSAVQGSVSSNRWATRVDIDEHPVLRYVQRNADGSLSIGQLNADGVHILTDADPRSHDATRAPRIDQVECRYLDARTVRYVGAACSNARMVVHVPPKSVVENYTIDLSKK